MLTLNENVQSLQLFALLVCLWLLLSRWANPRDGRKPRQRRGGIVHGLRAALCVSFVVVCYWLYVSFTRTGLYLHRVGAPSWAFRMPGRILPSWVQYLGAAEYLRRTGELDASQGGKP